MRILKEGHLPEKRAKIFRGECGNCHAIIECAEEELSRTLEGERPCPTSGCFARISMKEYTMRSGEQLHE